MPTERSRARGRRHGVVTGLLVLVLTAGVVVGGVLLWTSGVGPLPDPVACRAEAGGTVTELSVEQAENAATIAGVAVRRGLPARAVSIALATAYQESKLRNLDHGDRDSLGLFQQRPSQGWGTPGQITTPVYAANAFYDALEKVDGYQRMRITEAAQRVQRSGFPEAYEDHAADGRALASALTGYTAAGFSCVIRTGADLPLQDEGRSGLTPRAERVRGAVTRVFGDLAVGGFAPGGVSTGHTKGSAHYDGRALDIFVRPVDAENRRTGWAIASYLVAHATRLQVDHVIFDKRIWSAGPRSEQGWRDYTPPRSGGDRTVLEHRDHVHVDVEEGA